MAPGSVASEVEVACDPATAFAAFTEELDLWWVRSPISFYESARAVAMRLDPGVGGRIIEDYGDDAPLVIATIKVGAGRAPGVGQCRRRRADRRHVLGERWWRHPRAGRGDHPRRRPGRGRAGVPAGRARLAAGLGVRRRRARPPRLGRGSRATIVQPVQPTATRPTWPRTPRATAGPSPRPARPGARRRPQPEVAAHAHRAPAAGKRTPRHGEGQRSPFSARRRT